MKTPMKIKTALVATALTAMSRGAAQAQEADTVQVDAMTITQSNLRPGYGEAIESASIEGLDEAVAAYPEFETDNQFMSDEGVFRYAYYEKTGIWLDRNSAEQEMADIEW